jgi:hypothetical protein
VIENSFLIQVWSRGRTVTSPLDDYIQAGFVQIDSISYDSLLVRRP